MGVIRAEPARMTDWASRSIGAAWRAFDLQLAAYAALLDVTLDASGAQASFPFAAQAMKGPKVLDTGDHPQIIFESTSVQVAGKGARVLGLVTIRGVSKPMVLDAQIYRQKGTAEGDLSHLSIRLTGAVQRSQFGATGWADMVGDEVRLNILARIARVN